MDILEVRVKIEWDDDALRRMTNDIVQDQAGRLQEVLDRVFKVARGKNLEWVKARLAQEWQSELGGEITEPELSEYAQTLVEGRRIKVRPELKP